MKRSSRRTGLRWIAPLVAIFVATVSCAADLPIEASYYAAGFEPAFDKFASVMHQVKDCNRQLGNLCDERAIPNLDYALRVIDSITIFGPGDNRNGDTVFRDENEFLHRARREQDDFFRLLQAYEEDLIARLVAVSLVCRQSSVERLTVFQKVDFIRVWGLPEAQLKLVFRRISAKEKSLVSEIRNWPIDRCNVTRDFGDPLVQLLRDRTAPFKGELDPIPTRARQFGSGGTFVIGVALTLQASVDRGALQKIAIE